MDIRRLFRQRQPIQRAPIHPQRNPNKEVEGCKIRQKRDSRGGMTLEFSQGCTKSDKEAAFSAMNGKVINFDDD